MKQSTYILILLFSTHCFAMLKDGGGSNSSRDELTETSPLNPKSSNSSAPYHFPLLKACIPSPKRMDDCATSTGKCLECYCTNAYKCVCCCCLYDNDSILGKICPNDEPAQREQNVSWYIVGSCTTGMACMACMLAS